MSPTVAPQTAPAALPPDDPQREALHNDKRFLSFAQFRRLVLRAQALSQCPWLGLNVGDSTHLAVHGALGALWG